MFLAQVKLLRRNKPRDPRLFLEPNRPDFPREPPCLHLPPLVPPGPPGSHRLLAFRPRHGLRHTLPPRKLPLTLLLWGRRSRPNPRFPTLPNRHRPPSLQPEPNHPLGTRTIQLNPPLLTPCFTAVATHLSLRI